MTKFMLVISTTVLTGCDSKTTSVELLHNQAILILNQDGEFVGTRVGFGDVTVNESDILVYYDMSLRTIEDSVFITQSNELKKKLNYVVIFRLKESGLFQLNKEFGQEFEFHTAKLFKDLILSLKNGYTEEYSRVKLSDFLTTQLVKREIVNRYYSSVQVLIRP